MSNEFYNAWQTSNLIFEGDRIERIPEGMFAVVICAIAYCPWTDGRLNRNHRSIVRLWGSVRLAQWHAAKLSAQLDMEDGEQWYEVLPKISAPPPVVLADEDIPF